ncbi:MAG: hypothetical protein HY000_20430 [Planctomycetes bacterium]|nr:hypothetical protein [Planctomycetota bacterium]
MLVVGLLTAAAGCGSTRWSDTQRTATEQMLISDAVDKSVNQLDFRVLSGKEVYFKDEFLKGTVDQVYVASSIRQHLLATGCILKEKPEEATYVVEARAGAVGTDRHDLLFGVPAFSLPAIAVGGVGSPQAIPEIPFAKKTDQRGVAKIAVFAYNRTTGRAVWQSGIAYTTSNAKDLWFFGAGPFRRGTIYEGTQFGGEAINIPLFPNDPQNEDPHVVVGVRSQAIFTEPEQKSSVAGAPPAELPAAATMPAGVMRLPPLENQLPQNQPMPQVVSAQVPLPAPASPVAPQSLPPSASDPRPAEGTASEPRQPGRSLFSPRTWFRRESVSND